MKDPTDTSLAMADANGNDMGRMVYDGYGGVLTSTLPLTLTAMMPELPDAATGLVHQGGGRWYDPALGRPLQPNPMGGPAALPQALNRYTATTLGQPGVYEAGAANSLPPLLTAAVSNAASAGGGAILSAYARSGLVGDLLIQANNRILQDAGYSALFNRVMGPGRGRSAYYLSGAVRQIDEGVFESLEAPGSRIALSRLESEVVSGRWPVTYPAGEAFDAFDDNLWKQTLRTTAGEFAAGTAINISLSYPELVAPWQSPYFNTGQRLVQNAVTISGAAVSAGAGLWVSGLATTAGLGGPVTVILVTGTGVIVYVTWENIVKPGVSWFAVNVLQAPDPYQGIRNLKPVGVD